MADSGVHVISAVSQPLHDRVRAPEVLKRLGLRGGGRPDFAQGGGVEPSGVEALRKRARAKRREKEAATPSTAADVTTGRVEVAGGPTGTQISLQHAEQPDVSYRGRTDPQGRFVRDGRQPRRAEQHGQAQQKS